MRTALYTRVSTDYQVEDGFSLSAQLERLRAYCDSQGWSIVDIYTDEGLSAKSTDRPQLQRLLNDARNKKFDVVLVYKLDRLTRSVLDLYELLQVFDRHNVAFKSATEVYDTGSAMGRLFITLVAALAQWERENLGERVSFGIAEKARQGNRIGSTPPFGYDLVDGKLIVNPAEASVVREIFRRYISGEGSRRIVGWLNNEGVPSASKRSWHQVGVHYVLANPVYTGKVRYGAHARSKTSVAPFTVVGEHEPIISQETFDRARDIHEGRKRLPSRSGTGMYPLVGVLRCGLCGGPMAGKGNIRKNVRPYFGYVCQNRGHKGTCMMKQEKRELVERAVLDELIRMAEQMESNLLEVVPERRQPDDISGIEATLADVRRRKRRWMEAFETGNLDVIMLRERLEELTSQESTLTAKLRDIKTAPDTTNELLSYLKRLPELWDVAEVQEQKELIRSVVDNVYLYPGGKVTIELRSTFD